MLCFHEILNWNFFVIFTKFFGGNESYSLLVQAELELSFSSDSATTDWLRFGAGHFKTKKDNAIEINACHPLWTYG